MRSLIGFLLLVTGLIAGLVFVILPLAARPLVESAVRAALPVENGDLHVEVGIDPLGLLGGTVQAVRISGTGIATAAARADALELQLHDVSVFDRTFTAVRGHADGLTLRLADGPAVAVSRVEFDGSSTAVSALAWLTPDAATAIVRSALEQGGVPGATVRLVAGGVEVAIAGQRVTVPLGIEDGGLVLAPVAGQPALAIVTPERGASWRFTAVTVLADGMEVSLAIDPAALLAGR